MSEISEQSDITSTGLHKMIYATCTNSSDLKAPLRVQHTVIQTTLLGTL